MILRLLAVALLDLPQTVIIPGQHMVRVGFQRALVPDLRELVVTEFAIGIADQVGDVRVIVVAQRLQVLDRGSIFVAIIDRRIGRAIPLRKSGIVDAGVLTGFFGPLAMGGFRAEAEGGGSPPPPPPPPAAKAGVNEGATTSAIENVASAANLIIVQLAMQTSCLPARVSPTSRNCLPRLASNIPGTLFRETSWL
jgi:hypothetical protein